MRGSTVQLYCTCRSRQIPVAIVRLIDAYPAGYDSKRAAEGFHG